MLWVGSGGEEKRSLRFDSSAEFGVESSRTKGSCCSVSGSQGQMGVG